jgi:hypothetical protein
MIITFGGASYLFLFEVAIKKGAYIFYMSIAIAAT